ncbi:phage tail sheath subtilisin-like domain-containing protein [Gammaproteobacteria bacterium AH-315-C21]|nr:phage tail sheath subtilisin-like domain-containing protein [Gammaproteobacteria bacterium AH-315-C21]
MDQFLHGVEVVEIDNGPRPISTVRASVIGLVGTAPTADSIKFPLNTPVLIAGNRIDAAMLGTTGTLPKSIDGIFDQAGAVVVVVRVEEDADYNITLANIIGGVDPLTEQREGLQALLYSESVVHVKPRLLIAPGFTHELSVATEIDSIAHRLRGIGIIDGPSTTHEDALNYAANFGSARLYLVDPAVKVFDTVAAVESIEPSSARVAGLIARQDNERGYWWSPSNTIMRGIVGTERSIDFSIGDFNSRANLLNENNVATIVRQDGYRLWGNRTLSSDPKFAFLNVRRTADIIHDSVQRAHLWAIDRNITRTYLEDVVAGVNNYIRYLSSIGAIINGKAWADADLNTPDQISQGKVFIDFDFSANYSAEHITFRSHLVDDYLEEILPFAA